jgi:hypothetical protein
MVKKLLKFRCCPAAVAQREMGFPAHINRHQLGREICGCAKLDSATPDLRDLEGIGSMRLFDAGGLLAEGSAHR